MAISDPRQKEQRAQIWQKQDRRIIYVIMKTMCPSNYHHNGFAATNALGRKAIVLKTGRAHCLHDCIYIMPIYMYYPTSKNPSVVNTICIIHSTTLMRLPQENFN